MATTVMVLSGNIAPADLARLTTDAKGLGLQVAVVTAQDLPEPRWTSKELEGVSLTNYFKAAKGFDPGGADAAYLRRYNLQYAAGLTSMTSNEFFEPHKEWTKHEARTMRHFILHFMVANRICFSNMDPAAFFQTPCSTSVFSVRTSNVLLREQLDWVELLLFVTAPELLDLRNFGSGLLKEVRAVLAQRQLRLKGE